MATKPDHKAAIEALHLVVIELNLTQRRMLKPKLLEIQKALGDDTDIDGFARTTVSSNSTGAGRGSHWAERRLLQKYQMVDENHEERIITQEELLLISRRTHQQLQVAFAKGKGFIQIPVKNPRSYGSIMATITKL